ncbi:MAG: VOC family protein [Promethearchaeota archaeon]
MSLTFQGINQLGFVVNDAIEIARRQQILFNCDSPVIIDAEVKADFWGQAITPYKIKIAFLTLGELQLEFIQVLAGTPTVYTDFLDQCGEGLHHVGINVPNLQKALDGVVDEGIEVLWSGVIYSVPFAYLDTQQRFGTIIELIELSPPNPLGT